MRQKVVPNLWFDSEAEEAARFYVSIFPNSKIGSVARYDDEVAAVAGKPAGSVMTVAFELNGNPFLALNGGPRFKFNESISFIVNCDTQEEVDHFWERLSERGEQAPCGWLKDRYGVSWQIVPTLVGEVMEGSDEAKRERLIRAILPMKKLDIETLRRAVDGST